MNINAAAAAHERQTRIRFLPFRFITPGVQSGKPALGPGPVDALERIQDINSKNTRPPIVNCTKSLFIEILS
jgi:hypothetical protein